MSYFEFPHTRSYEGDLGYIIKKLDDLNARYNNFFDYNSIRFHDPLTWNIATVYPAFNIVYDMQSAALYISKTAVPAGIDITNGDYWLLVSPFKIDLELNADSINPVANKVIYAALSVSGASITELNNRLAAEIEVRGEADAELTAGIENNAAAIATETATRAAADTTINARIDEIISGASVDPDAELLDVRVGANGVTYSSAGDAVRGQYGELINDVVKTVPISSDDVLEGYTRGADGAFVSGTSYRTIKPMKLEGCKPGAYIYVKTSLVSGAGVAFYDKGLNYITGYNWDALKPTGGRYGLNAHLGLIIPTGAYYIATTIQAADYTEPADFVIMYADLNGTEINNPDSNILNVGNGNAYKFDSIYTIGSIDNNGDDTTATNRLRSGYIDISDVKEISTACASGYSIAIHFYTSAKAHIESVDYTANKIISKPDTTKYARIIIKNDNSSTAAVSWAENAYLIGYPEHSNAIDILSGAAWVLGSIDSTGANVDVTSRIRTNFIEVYGLESIFLNIAHDYGFVYVFYNKAKTRLVSDGYLEGYKYLKVPANAYYVRFVVRSFFTDSASTSWADYFTATGSNTLSDKLLKNSIDISGYGSLSYKGDKVDLADIKDQVNGASISAYINFTKAEIEDITDYKFHLNQSMAINNGVIFLFSEEGLGTAVNYSTKEIISSFALPLPVNNHYNSAIFSDIYYDSDDTFPLLFMSRCGNVSTPETGADECLILRITRSDDTFTCTLINFIYSDAVTWGCDWNIDINNKTISLTGYFNGDYLTTGNNPVKTIMWRLPEVSEIISGNAITLSTADIIGEMKIDHFIFQGSTVKNGVLFIGLQPLDGGRFIYGLDITKGVIKHIIPLTSDFEIEGVAVYNNKLFVSQKDGSDTTGINPLKIFELTF